MDGVGADAVGAFGSRIESSGRAYIADRDEACRRPVGHPPRDRLRHARFALSERVGSLRVTRVLGRMGELEYLAYMAALIRGERERYRVESAR